MKVVMTLLVRDEEDILRENIDFHLKQGVDHFIVTDNLSLDSTSEVVKLFWPRVYSISNTDIPIHLGSIHRCMNAA